MKHRTIYNLNIGKQPNINARVSSRVFPGDLISQQKGKTWGVPISLYSPPPRLVRYPFFTSRWPLVVYLEPLIWSDSFTGLVFPYLHSEVSWFRRYSPPFWEDRSLNSAGMSPPFFRCPYSCISRTKGPSQRGVREASFRVLISTWSPGWIQCMEMSKGGLCTTKPFFLSSCLLFVSSKIYSVKILSSTFGCSTNNPKS